MVMSNFQKRIVTLSNVVTIGLAVFFAAFWFIKFYLWLWRFLGGRMTGLRPVLNWGFWLFLPIFLSLLTTLLLLLLKKADGQSLPSSRFKFYLLSFGIFLGMVLIAIFHFGPISWILSIWSALIAILLFARSEKANQQGEAAS